MNVPTEYELSDSISFFKEMKKNYFLILKIKKTFFLIRCDYSECNIYEIFAWLFLQHKIYEDSKDSNPTNCLINKKFNSNYKSLLSSLQKIENLITFINDYKNLLKPNIDCSKYFLKKCVKAIVCMETENGLNLFDVIEPGIDLKTMNRFHEEIKVIGIFKDYRMFDFLLTYEVPFISYMNKQIYLFTEKNLNKFIIDIKFLYNLFYNLDVKESYFSLLIIKKSLQRSIDF